MQSSDDADKVGLIIDGREHRDWERYEVDSDLLTPADGWRVSLGLPAPTDGQALPEYVRPWAPVTLTLGGQVILRGRLDSMETDVAKDAHTLSLSGRDLAGVLVDCSAPVFSARQCGLDEIVAKMVRPLGITSIKVEAGTARHDKISVDPGMTAWDALERVCEQNGCWPYFAPDGTLVIGGPDYTDATNPPVGQLTVRASGQDGGKGNNVLRLVERRGVQERYSEVTVLGQGHGTESAEGAHNIRATAKDSAADAPVNRPKIVVEADCETTGHAQRRARKIVADGKLAAYEIHASVRGHRVLGAIGASGLAPLWTPGQRVRVVSEPHGISGVYYLMRRTFLCGRGQGQITELALKPDGLWQPDVSHHKRHKRKAGAGAGAGGIVDL
ncbi:Mu-like prophage tail protein gpP [Humidesulfovibrio mexicanus]|uniref:Mu-like prophage tail protein gpP n=1 Tax=Humidesulfovibrio mexicanus TaxID=147047 RepID=A0A239AI64_9BACT|nr:phage tail protein [Humidesulfovibrio mexicanus]SNR95230.1 Mu-like prophage tail protein gpP [Humidesulfovibrio mexicanus]